ncbi:tetratricopeptide repeat protein [Sphingobacterium sp. DK4209]|uniref:Tetratricopeptide repeat protein n=2 Tax=Sphingobacterium zhuxiongii TaxID=2662364 RepID=A0A5Q0QFB6_9SPHI|nr:tetratricopeptide repeat protein [Sphingobacterium sp. DK4209]MVZ65783.1 tetratricopeptide repeat protein [Sphingobacterium sp. DK4209]QGA27979.1 tetratricopeptide repeat protein [Sphingobacterium sp. dk4302]
MEKAISRMFNKVRVLLAIVLIISLKGVKAQSGSEVLDPAGFVTKYNPNFKGIGPEVYNLPAPRTKEEVLVDSYKEKNSFYDSIARQLDYQNLIEEFQQTSNSSYLIQQFQPFPNSAEKWMDLINSLKRNNNTRLAAGLLNVYALEATKQNDIKKSIALLAEALGLIQNTEFKADASIVQFNLANAHLYQRSFSDADALQEQYLQKAIDSKRITDQANSLVQAGLIRAHQKEYKAAENSIIRRAIPIYNKTKDFSGKTKAWIQLAKIYQLQNKHTEAQWFLIQARDLANSKNFKMDLPEIEYMLGYSKFMQQNYRVAKLELEKAKTLADGENNKALQLAIHDKLGEIDMIMGNYESAEAHLSEYWKLRKELF